jgi:hypothetical protein
VDVGDKIDVEAAEDGDHSEDLGGGMGWRQWQTR